MSDILSAPLSRSAGEGRVRVAKKADKIKWRPFLHRTLIPTFSRRAGEGATMQKEYIRPDLMLSVRSSIG